MIRWEKLDSAKVPGGEAELRLMRRGAEYSIMSGAIELMNSRLGGSEEALATLAWARLQGRPNPRLLIGGLGMGFTLRAALSVLPPSARIDVAELSPAVIAWAHGPMSAVFAGCLEDPRVTIREGDVAPMIEAANAAYDAILLDVDNGPGGLGRPANDDLYDLPGLAAARRALRPGGVLAVWSAAPDEAFTRRLGRAGFIADAVPVRAGRRGRGARHTIWLATPR